MKRIIFAVILLSGVSISIFIIFLIYIFTDSYIDNNQILKKYVTEFQNIEHPSNTSSVMLRSGIFPLPGNGSNCNYFVAEIRRFSADKSNINNFYRDKGIPFSLIKNGGFGQEVPYGFNELANWNAISTVSNDDLYLIYTLNADFKNYHKNTIDLRCH